MKERRPQPVDIKKRDVHRNPEELGEQLADFMRFGEIVSENLLINSDISNDDEEVGEDDVTEASQPNT